MVTLSHKERLEMVLAGKQPDRIPVALWRHFPVDDQDPDTLAVSILEFQKDFEFDLVKITPASSYCLKDWGVEDVWEGNPEGVRSYKRHIIDKPQDWEKLKPLNPRKGALNAQLECITRIKKHLEGGTPLVQTIFNPLAQAKNLAGGSLLLEHLRRYPEAVRNGLDVITMSTVRFVQECMEIGVDGIFLAVQHAAYRILSREEYQAWGSRDDLHILQAARNAWLNILHLHGEAVLFDLAEEYPVAVVNWHDRESGPSLQEGHRRSGKTVCGGWRQWQTIALGDPGKIQAEARDAVRQMNGRSLILGTGCVTPIITPRACLQAAARIGEDVSG